ncbi:hypothetical protein Avbf_10703 [Armadillidium vulgare]|nr:hypothetical protein Avbf_10703 [Armadillidium vulgare]
MIIENNHCAKMFTIFYVDPSVAFKNGDSFQVKSESSSSASTPGSDNRSLGSVNVNSFASVSRPSTTIQNASSSPSLNGLVQSSTMKTSSSVDLLNSLTKNSTSTSAAKSTDQKDPFGTPVSVQPPTESFANFDNANIFSTDDSFISCPLPSSVENLSSHSEFPSHLPSTPDSTHSASPSNKHPDPNISLSQAHSSESPPSPGPWEGYEEELSAAMPLIPTGELPPTYQPVHKSGSKKNVAESPVLFAAGVSAQFVFPSNDKRIPDNSIPRREGRASSLPLIFSESPKDKQRRGICDINGGSSIAIATRCEDRSKVKPPSPPQSMEDVFVHDDFNDLETELGAAMPLLSLDPAKGERNFEGSGRTTPQSVKNYNRNLSLPLGNSSFEDQSELHDPHKRNSLTSLNSKPPSFFPSPKAIRKVFSFHNISSETSETKMEKKPVPRQLSAISKKVRARLMSDEDVRVPKNLSSSLPDCTPSPLAEADRQRSQADSFLSRPFPKSEYIDMSDPVTIVYAKQKNAINQSLFFTNRSSSFQNLEYEITSLKDSRKPFSDSEDENINNSVFSNSPECADKGANDFQSGKNTDIITSCMAKPKAMHGSLPSLSNFTNNTNSENNMFLSSVNAVKMSKESSGCSISMANLTSLASHFVAGASISKPTPNPSYPPFSSNPLIPHSFSSSSSNTSKPPTSMSVSNLSTLGSGTNANSAQIEDRYAALKDLDEAFKSQKEVENPTSNSVVFGSPPTGSGQAQTGNIFGTSPVSGGNGFYANSSSTFQNQGWNPTFPPVNPFSANGSANTTTPWPSGSKFGNPVVTQGQQSNPFAGGTDPTINNGQFVPNFGMSNSNTANANANNWSNFGNPGTLTNGSNKFNTNPWGAGPTPNPFNGPPPPVVPPNGGSTSYNPFL